MFRIKRKKNNLAIFIFDDVKWQMIIKDKNGKSKIFFPENSSNSETLPEELLAHAKKEGCTRLKIVIPEDTHSVKVKIPEYLDKEEIHNLIAWEAASILGLNAELSRMAFVKSSSFNIGGNKTIFIVSHFKKENINEFIAQSAKFAITFDGISSLQLAIIAIFNSLKNETNESLIFMRRHSSFGLIPGLNERELTIRNIPVGIPNKNQPLEEWGKRLSKRLPGMIGNKIHLFISEKKDNWIFEQISKSMSNPNIRTSFVSEYIEEVVNIAEKSLISYEKQECPFISLAPKSKDPKRVGTIICFITVVFTIIAIIGQLIFNKYQIESIRDKIKQNKEMNAIIKNRESTFKSLENKITKIKKILKLIDDKSHLNSMFIEIITLLNKEIPRYLRIISIKQKGMDVEITGLSMSQDSVVQFGIILEKRLSSKNIQFFPEKISNSRNTNEIKFKLRARRK